MTGLQGPHLGKVTVAVGIENMLMDLMMKHSASISKVYFPSTVPDKSDWHLCRPMGKDPRGIFRL